MKLIQICGNNGCGKTTVVRQFIARFMPDYEIVSITACGHKIECHKQDDIVVIGRYDKAECGGCDVAIRNATELKDAIAIIAKTVKPKVLIFEGVMYGKSFALRYEINKFAKAIGSDYMGICLEPPFDVTLERIYARNGGKEVNVKSLESGWRGAIKSNRKLKKVGVNITCVDTGSIPKDKMYEVLASAVMGDLYNIPLLAN